MGVNFCKVSNKTGRPQFILTYNDADTVYWIARDVRQLPANGSPVEVDGLAGGAAVKVAVVYGNFRGRTDVVCDLFRLPHGTHLEIKEVSQGSGVISFNGQGVQLLERGKVIHLDAPAAEKIINAMR